MTLLWNMFYLWQHRHLALLFAASRHRYEDHWLRIQMRNEDGRPVTKKSEVYYISLCRCCQLLVTRINGLHYVPAFLPKKDSLRQSERLSTQRLPILYWEFILITNRTCNSCSFASWTYLLYGVKRTRRFRKLKSSKFSLTTE